MRLSRSAHAGLFALSLSSLSLLCPSADAAEWHRQAGTPRQGTAAQIADAYLSEDMSLQLSGVTLQRVTELKAGAFSTVRYQQMHSGLPVLDSAAAVHVSPDGRVVATVLQVARGLVLATTPSITPQAARQAAAALHGRTGNETQRAELMIWPGARGDQARLVWSVTIPTLDGGYRHLVDAHSGRSLEQRALARHGLGRVYPISAVVTPMTQDVELTDMVPSTPQMLTGWDGNLTVANYESGNIQMGEIVATQTLLPTMGEDFLYDPPADPLDATDGFAQVGLYHHMTRYRDYFTNTHGVDFSPASWKLTAVANITSDGTPLDNAFFSPQGIGGDVASPNMIGIGQGSMFDFADDSDVFLHEMTHYVSANAVGFNGGQTASTSYGLSPFGGSIDEGISDYFACTINDDPILGEASLALISAVRDLSDTSKRCTDDMVAEVHADGEIIGSFGWTLRTTFGQAIGDELVWGATTLLTPNPSMSDFARGVQQVAADMEAMGQLTQADLDTIDDFIEERGLHECDEEVPLREDEPRRGVLFGLDLVGQLLGVDCNTAKGFGVELQSLFHYVVTPDSDAIGIRVSGDLMPLGSGELDWGLYGRVGEHVSFASQGFLPVVTDFDYSQVDISGENGELVIDADSDPPFDPNTTYHFVLAHQNCPLANMEISVEQITESSGSGGAGGSAGVGGGGGGGGEDPVIVDEGCGCRLAPGSGSNGGALALLAMAAGAGLLRRRRRRA